MQASRLYFRYRVAQLNISSHSSRNWGVITKLSSVAFSQSQPLLVTINHYNNADTYNSRPCPNIYKYNNFESQLDEMPITNRVDCKFDLDVHFDYVELAHLFNKSVVVFSWPTYIWTHLRTRWKAKKRSPPKNLVPLFAPYQNKLQVQLLFTGIDVSRRHCGDPGASSQLGRALAGAGWRASR